MSYKKGYVETSIPVEKDPARVYFINPQAIFSDLLPTGKPPIITGLSIDGQKILVDFGSGIPMDVYPLQVGLSAQTLIALQELFNK